MPGIGKGVLTIAYDVLLVGRGDSEDRQYLAFERCLRSVESLSI